MNFLEFSSEKKNENALETCSLSNNLHKEVSLATCNAFCSNHLQWLGLDFERFLLGQELGGRTEPLQLSAPDTDGAFPQLDRYPQQQQSRDLQAFR